ncbi:MAG: GAF domain-containing protein [Oligoflexia bacterium]|nr:GAF domain-containing protein [Oligoflexia bacterium]
MAAKGSQELFDELRQTLSRVVAPQQVVDGMAQALCAAFPEAMSRCVLRWRGVDYSALDQSARSTEVRHARTARSAEISIDAGQLHLGELVLPVPLVISDLRRARLDPQIMAYMDGVKARSYVLIPLYIHGAVSGWCEIVSERLHFWSKNELSLIQQLAEFAGYAVSERLELQAQVAAERGRLESELDESRRQYQRLIESGSLIVVRTNPSFEVTAVHGDTKTMLGVAPEQLLNDRNVWSRFLPSRDRRNLARMISQMGKQKREVSTEVRILREGAKDPGWLLIRAIPLFKEDGTPAGWEGFGLDISEKHAARDEIIEQSRRIEALYEVARALQVNVDPALVTLRGLRALIAATSSDSGFVCFYDRENDQLELVSSEGLSTDYIDEVTKVLSGRTLIRQVVEQREGLLINNIQEDARALVDLARKEGLRSAILMPLLVKDEVQGALALFCRQAQRYSAKDFDLVSAASSQICLAVRQAESYLAEKRQVSALGALYRLSHDLSKQLTPKQIAERAFPIIQGELACKRMWLGVLNEQGTHLIGQAGLGPGVRSRLIDVQLSLDEQHDFLDEALRKKQPVIVKPGQEYNCSRLTRILKRLELGMFVIVPLVSLGQTVGVLLVEPAFPSSFLLQRKLSLLSSMAAEIAAVVLSRRFENKIAEAEKMRVAGLLASGVAHNFNNLLQAVLGQASLIEMQLPKDAPVRASARMIVDAANRGASLIRQLLSFSMPSAAVKADFSLAAILRESVDLYKSILGPSIVLDVRLSEGVPQVCADAGRIQNVLTNLLVNAKDALSSKQDGMVRISLQSVRLAPGEIDPDLAPGEYVRLDVEDNGAGMEPEKQARCFEPFFTTKNVDRRTGLSFSGSGLGLSSAYSTLKSFDGAITVSSTLGQGSVFSLYLPAVQAKVVSPVNNVGESAIAETLAQPKRLAVVQLSESEEVVSAQGVLQTFGFNVELVKGTEQLGSAAAAMPPASALLVLDLDVLAVPAEQYIDNLRKVAPELKVFGLCKDLESWSTSLGAQQHLYLLERPLSVWAMQVALKRAFPGLSVERTAEGLSNGKSPRELPRLHLVDKRGVQVAGEGKG